MTAVDRPPSILAPLALGEERVMGTVTPRTARAYQVSVVHDDAGYVLRLTLPGYPPLLVGAYETLEEAVRAATVRMKGWAEK